MEKMEVFCVRNCWGNYAFDFIHSNSVGNSGGILCVWDPNSFRKSSSTISDYFVIVRGVWRKSGTDLIIIAVYAPHDPRDKRMLWDYLMHVINQWNGEVIIMGDFNEVRYKSDRFGSIFNSQGADEFNSFIVNAGLEEVPLGGSTFTWCHKSATKMSKLDRFLVSDNLFTICPHISAITLERYLSDHRPILLREAANDYGPVLFRFFHHWLELDGFSKFVVDTWNIAPVDVSNGMRNMVGKMRYLKLKIREWIKSNRPNRKELVDRYKDELRMLDVVIDKGDGTDAVVTKRMEVINSMQQLDHLHALDMAQKAKIKWVVEGDENTRFFHGMLNKKRNQQNIRGVMVIAKILANRLVGVLGIIVNEVQSAFITGRHILDGPLILNERVVDVGMFKGIKLSQSLSLSHMFYADDAVFVGQWILVDTDEKVKHAASKLGCLTFKSPFLYLGTKVGATMSRVSDWKEVVEKVKSRLSKWKMKALSIGGRLTLLIVGVSEGILKDLFPRLYALESCKLVNVCTKLNDPNLPIGGFGRLGDSWVDFFRSSFYSEGLLDEKRLSMLFAQRLGIDIHSILCPVCDGGVEVCREFVSSSFGVIVKNRLRRKVFYSGRRSLERGAVNCMCVVFLDSVFTYCGENLIDV
ncbi:RNA-directed DNA polymerase, eukaryota [Tanacetum coccineum]